MAPRSARTGAGIAAALEDLVFRPFRDDDLGALLALFQASFPRWPRVDVSVEPIEHLRWKMRLDETEERRSNVAELDGKIIADSVSVSIRARLHERVVLCPHDSDMAYIPSTRASACYRACDSGRMAISRTSHSCWGERAPTRP